MSVAICWFNYSSAWLYKYSEICESRHHFLIGASGLNDASFISWSKSCFLSKVVSPKRRLNSKTLRVLKCNFIIRINEVRHFSCISFCTNGRR